MNNYLVKKNKIDTKINFRSPSFRKYLTNTSWLFVEKLIRIIIGFFVTVYIIRYLGPAQFGLLSYVTSFVFLFSSIATLGLDNIIIRDIVNESDARDEVLGTSFLLRISGSAISFILIGITVFLTSENNFNIILIFIIAISTSFQAFNVIDSYFQSRVQSKYSVYVKIVSFIIITVLKLLLIIFNYSLIYFAIVTSFETIIMAGGYTFIYHFKSLKIFNWRFSKKRAFQLLKDAWPLILSGLVISVYMKIDQVMIKKMLNDTEVGLYAAAVRISEAWYFIPVAISTSLFPAILNAKKISDELYLARLQKLYDILAWMAIGIGLVVTLFSTDLVKILLGTTYLPAVPVIKIYIWAGVAVFLGVASSQFLISENLTKISFIRSFLGMIVNVILNLLFIPILGIIGSALATLISYTIATFSLGFKGKTGRQFLMMLKAILFINLYKYLINYLSRKRNV